LQLEKSAARRRENVAILRISIDVRRQEATLAALKRTLLRVRSFVLDRLVDLMQPHVWAVDDAGDLLGHILTVDDAIFEQAADAGRVDVLTLPEALDLRWSNVQERAMWAALYVDALRRIATGAEAAEKASADNDELWKAIEPNDQADQQ